MAWISTLRSSPKMLLFVVSFALFVEESLYGLVVPLTTEAPAGIRDVHVVSNLYGAFALGMVIATLSLGLFTERIGRKRSMEIGVILLITATVLLCIGTRYELFYAGRMLEGMGAACTWTAGLALVAEHHVKSRVKAMGWVMLGATTGSIVGPIIGGHMVERLGYRPPFYFMLALLAIDAVFCFGFITSRKNKPYHAWSETFNEIKGIVTDHSVISAAVAVALAAASWALMEPLFPVHAQSLGNGTPAMVGAIFTGSNLLYAFLAPATGYVSDRIGVRQTAVVGLVLTAIAMPLLALSSDLVQATLVLCAITIGYAFTINPTSAELGDAVDRRGSSSYAVAYAMYNLSYSFGMIGVDSYVEFVTDEAHKLELFHILLSMSALFLLCIPFFVIKSKSATKAIAYEPEKEAIRDS